MVNRVTLIGNLGRDPEIRTLENGVMVANFSIATDESYKGNDGTWVERTEWHDVVAWRALAERAQRTLKKGMMVFVEGKLQTRKYQDQNGNDRYKTEVVANYFRILNSRDGVSANAPANVSAVNEPAATQGMDSHGEEPPQGDDLPF
jgi:single-strand DNA-binding protein